MVGGNVSRAVCQHVGAAVADAVRGYPRFVEGLGEAAELGLRVGGRERARVAVPVGEDVAGGHGRLGARGGGGYRAFGDLASGGEREPCVDGAGGAASGERYEVGHRARCPELGQVGGPGVVELIPAHAAGYDDDGAALAALRRGLCRGSRCGAARTRCGSIGRRRAVCRSRRALSLRLLLRQLTRGCASGVCGLGRAGGGECGQRKQEENRPGAEAPRMRCHRIPFAVGTILSPSGRSARLIAKIGVRDPGGAPGRRPPGLPAVADGRPLRGTDQSGPQSAVWLAEANGRPKRRANRRWPAAWLQPSSGPSRRPPFTDPSARSGLVQPRLVRLRPAGPFKSGPFESGPFKSGPFEPDSIKAQPD